MKDFVSTLAGSALCLIGIHTWRAPRRRCQADETPHLHQMPQDPNTMNTVRASSFADPADIVAFKKAKARGLSDKAAFAFGDNGVGKWGHFTAQDTEPMCALLWEDWQEAGKTGGAKVRVSHAGKTVEGILGDTMPRRRNIRNGARIDLNPAFAKALGLRPPFMVEGVTWEWA